MRFRPGFRMSSFTTSQRASDPSERSERIRSERPTEGCKSDNEKVPSSERAVFGLPIIVILGPTGSGKTGVSIEIAKKIGGEIISADSRAIYRGMDVGTAKPTIEEQQGIPHYGLDLVDPGERFTVSDWKSYAEEKIADIKSRGKVPMVVGGTGLYIDALIYDYHFKGPTGHKIGDYEQKTCSDRKEIKGDYLLIGIDWPPDELRARLAKRAEQMFCSELYDETRELVKRYGWGSQAMKSNIYEFAWRYLNGEISLEKAKELFCYDDWHLAKRQLTWFKRNKQIVWLKLNDVLPYVVSKVS